MTERFYYIYPWDKGATKDWDSEEDLAVLKSLVIDDLVKLLISVGAEKQVAAIVELEVHGNLKKAALVVRALKENPSFIRSLKKEYSDVLIRLFLKSKLHNLPSKPSEFEKNVKLIYVQ